MTNVAYEQCALIGCHSMLAPFRSVSLASLWISEQASILAPYPDILPTASCAPRVPEPFAICELKAAWAQLGIAFLMAEFHRTRVLSMMGPGFLGTYCII